ncbi:phosphosulfolactate synthase [Methanothermobacter tenebrarum]|uniref:Phosphosulfolactate synthase n=1 Tax=Methanothermobacter tenebrarum TaxID=680118 RepID=A0A328PD31_9EURY|nr:phosphosulfolactate synthase [Methanothermobacter tenebrarum]MBC7118444.1 phosphosulfolactate synthase [Methanobacteriaceae archaeon]NPV63987.1 phosphosulfolactate synthase [Methanobacteriaceae archaeon]RAO79163.1 phosphosulfolactate synthase [Methanothermobacter tenebrarum]
MHAFNFLAPARIREQYNTGITMMLDKGLGPRMVEDFLEIAGEHLDFVKFGWGIISLCDRDIIKEKIRIYRDYGVEAHPGGTLFEIAYIQGKLEEYFHEAEKLGFKYLEISDGSIDLPRQEKTRVIENTIDHGFKVISEVGKKDPRNDKIISLKERVEHVKHDLRAGAEKVLIEARESGQNIGVYDEKGNVKEDEVEYLIEHLPAEKLIWEAPQKNQQVYFILKIGPNANLGNIPPEDVISLESMRRGLRGDTLGKVKL